MACIDLVMVTNHTPCKALILFPVYDRYEFIMRQYVVITAPAPLKFPVCLIMLLLPQIGICFQFVWPHVFDRLTQIQ